MAYNIKFVKGLASEYTSLQTKDANTLYFTTDNGALYLGSKKFTNGDELAQALLDISENASDIEEIQAQLQTLLGGEGEGTSIQDMIDSAVADLEEKINGLLGVEDGDETPELETDADNIVEAINEVLADLEQAKTDLTTKVEKTTPEGIAARYTVTQGTNTIGTIDIPKDMVIKSGKVIKAVGNEIDGIEAGDELIELTIANNEEEKIYIAVKSLVDSYESGSDEDSQVIVVVNNDTNKITATIGAEKVTATELATDAVETEKIKDKAVTTDKINEKAITAAKIASNAIEKGKLETALQTSIDLANSAIQQEDIETGDESGTISVNGTDIKVKDIDTAAYAAAEDFDPAGSATNAKTAAINYTDTALTWGSFN